MTLGSEAVRESIRTGFMVMALASMLMNSSASAQERSVPAADSPYPAFEQAFSAAVKTSREEYRARLKGFRPIPQTAAEVESLWASSDGRTARRALYGFVPADSLTPAVRELMREALWADSTGLLMVVSRRQIMIDVEALSAAVSRFETTATTWATDRKDARRSATRCIAEYVLEKVLAITELEKSTANESNQSANLASLVQERMQCEVRAGFRAAWAIRKQLTWPFVFILDALLVPVDRPFNGIKLRAITFRPSCL